MRKKRVKNKDKVHFDEQSEGALMQGIKTLQPYADRGIIIMMTNDNKWKVVAFGCKEQNDSFEDILLECINAGAVSFFNKKSEIINWDL